MKCRQIILFFGLIGLFAGCARVTKFTGLTRADERPENKKMTRKIASESPMSHGCHTLIEDILYLKEQREVKEAEKRRKLLEAVKN